VWWGRVGKMIMNYQIPLKAKKKNENATISLERLERRMIGNID
jgi:hypothetical protein